MRVPGACPAVSTEPVFWFYVKDVLNKHELQRFCSLRHIASDVGRGRAWLRCALNEHSLERYLHTLLADRSRLRYQPRGVLGGGVRLRSKARSLESDAWVCIPGPPPGAAGFRSYSPSLIRGAAGTLVWRISGRRPVQGPAWHPNTASTQ